MINEITFRDELKQPTINIARAALRLARALAYPILDVNFYLERINTLAEAARPQVEACRTIDDRVDTLADFLFRQMDFRGNQERYSDPRNSYLNCVLDRKQGIPITLSVLYVTVAKKLGLNAYGIGLPGHFITGIYANGSEILIDPYHGGMRLTLADCDRLVRESTGYEGIFQRKWLSPSAPGAVLARMLSNLCNAYIRGESWNNAIQALQYLLLIQPETDFHLRDLGYLYLYNGSLRLSAQYLEEYLRRAPDADDFESVRSSLQVVAGRLALWN